MVSLGVLQVANYLIPFLVLPVISRILGASLFGSVSYAQNIVSYLTLLVNFGFEYSATRQIALAGEDMERKRRIFWSVLTMKGLLLLVSFVILAFLPLCIDRVAADPRLYIYAAMINIGFVLFPSWYLQGEQQMDKMALMNFFIKLSGAAMVLAVVRDASAYRLYPLLLSLASILVGVGALVYVIVHFRIGGYTCSRESLREVVAPGWPIFLNNLFGCLYTTVNMTLLGLYAADETVGYFSAAQRLVMALIMVVVLPVSTTVYPEISRRFEASKKEGMVFLKRVMLYAGIAAAVVSIATYIAAPLAIRLVYGQGFTPAVDILRWLSPIPFLVMTATLLTVQGLYGMGLQKWAPWVGGILAVLCISMNMILIPRIGVAAVCISWVVAEILECLMSGLILLTKGRKQTA
jgi:PST family polysaccharide transporter